MRQNGSFVTCPPSDLSHHSRLDFGGWAAILAALVILWLM
jgi:hypothetical protein